MELISIIMPAYNAESFIEASIKSVLAQTYQNWELLIVDDGSTDNTFSIAQGFALINQKIKISQQSNQGASVARNTAIEQAAGQWLAFLDADDLWEPQKLERQMAVSEAIPQADLIYTSGWKFAGNNPLQRDDYDIKGGLHNASEMYKLLYLYNDIPTLSVMARRDKVIAVGPMQPNLLCEDWDLWLRMALAGANYYGMHERLFYYRKHSAGASASSIKMLRAQVMVLVKNYQQELFTDLEIRRIFIPLLNHILITMIKQGEKTQAREVIQAVAGVLPAFSKLYQLFLPLLNSTTVGIFELSNRVYRKLLPSKQRSR